MAQYSVANSSTSPTNPGYPSRRMLQRIRYLQNRRALASGGSWTPKLSVADIYGIKRETSLSRDDYMEEVDKQTYNDWEASDIHHRLVAFLEEHAGTTTQVDQIICFGLVSPVSSRHPRILRRAYTQHLAACTIRDLFARHQNSPAPKILAQDPRYTPIDMAYLSTHFSTTTLPDPEAFRALNGTTFVISISPDVPVRQVALGMTHDSGGPAGFLCCAIEDNGLGCKSVTMQNGEEVFRFTDNSSPGLWEFKQKGVWAEWDDLEGGEGRGLFWECGVLFEEEVRMGLLWNYWHGSRD
ncbi:hypothetical protein SNOG_01885 [Parastagonospora nodorum SN15]|uniref:SRR1-like domain-containing protein n=1 Tax=Phaeosphaeria nodorum (strain SN15 / ATCC MYA-4574 / FGSC 10173) TaxID=321614 RepID=Q0V279_PHANO|nr:hypothetical protein SNOG_01885 [Parastagonospora nodorum SN15]EAT90097.1 hypothetical protein SNOG_01885 [Parastagonospora nodorum SN15]